MRTLTVISIGVLGYSFFASPTCAQVTNPCPAAPATKLESLNTNVAVVILKATTEIGSISANAGTVAVRCKQVTDTSTGHKEQGIAIEITQRGRLRDVTLIDYDEIPSLLNGIDYLNKLDISATSFNFLDAEYTTKGGFHIAALGTRRTGAIQFAIRDARTDSAPVIFSREQLALFVGFINQAKGTLDSLQGAAVTPSATFLVQVVSPGPPLT